jgi:UPF0716 family protein affecting phage T7 exclusion
MNSRILCQPSFKVKWLTFATISKVVGIMLVFPIVREVLLCLATSLLVSIFEANYFEEKPKKKKNDMSSAEMLGWLDRNQVHKSLLGIFVITSTIGAFLVNHKIMTKRRFQP